MQKERPLQVKFTDVKPERESSSRDRAPRDDRGGRDERGSRDRNDRGPREGGDRARTDRPREDRAPREDRPRREHNDENMVRYRIEVGRNHEARPGDIVGAIANEAGIASSNIGHIKLHDEFSTVDLPKGLSGDVLSQLKKVRVRNRPLEISVDQGSATGSNSGNKDFGDRGPRSFDKPHDDKPRDFSDRPPRSDKPRSFADKPRDGAPRSFSDKPRDGAPRSKLGLGDKSKGDKAKESKSFRPKKSD